MHIEITNDLLDELQEKANAATKGPWTHSTDGTNYWGEVNRGDDFVAITSHFIPKDDPCLWADTDVEKNAEFIASACPEVVLALVAELRKREAVIDWICEHETKGFDLKCWTCCHSINNDFQRCHRERPQCIKNAARLAVEEHHA